MKYFLTLLLLLGSWLGAWAAEEIVVDGFTINTRNDNTAKISYYSGDDESLIIPSMINYNGTDYTITEITKLLSSRTNLHIKEVFIPKSIKSIATETALFSFPNNSGIRTVIFEDASFTIGGHKPFDFLEGYSSSPFIDNIIILDKYSNDKKTLLHTNLKDALSLKPGRIKILYNSDKTEHYVQMFLFRQSDTTPWTFDKARLEDLISALRKAGKLANIKTIDLSGMSTTAAPIKFDGVETNFAYIEDLSEYIAPSSDLSAPIFYSRTDTQGWNSVCLPFPIRESDFPEGTKIYTMTGGNAEKILLNRIGESETLNAGTPCFIKSEASSWDLNINATIPAQVAPASVKQEGNSWVLYGSFSEILLGTGKYKLNGAGTEFVQTTEKSHAWPFRCYLEPKDNGSGAPARLSVGVDEEASITLVPNDAEPQTVKLIDLMGRPRQGNAPGLYIRSKH